MRLEIVVIVSPFGVLIPFADGRIGGTQIKELVGDFYMIAVDAYRVSEVEDLISIGSDGNVGNAIISLTPVGVEIANLFQYD